MKIRERNSTDNFPDNLKFVKMRKKRIRKILMK